MQKITYKSKKIKILKLIVPGVFEIPVMTIAKILKNMMVLLLLVV